MDEKVKYWVELSDYDMKTAVIMQKTARYLYVGFMCHQVIEKIIKAYFTAQKLETAPYSHSLSYLAKKIDLYDKFSEEQKNFIDQVEPLNIETRYPSYKEKLMKSLTKEKCKEILNNTKNLQEWIKEKL